MQSVDFTSDNTIKDIMQDMKTTNNYRIWRNMAIFSLVTAGGGWVGIWLDNLLGITNPKEGLGMLIWLVAPLLTALLLRQFAGDGWKDFGLRPTLRANLSIYAFSLLMYPLAIGITLLAGSAFGLITFTDTHTLVSFFSLAGSGFVASLIKNIFEEFSWRGYMTPRLAKTGLNDMLNHILVGVVWMSWHLPYWFHFLPAEEFSSYSPLPLVAFIPVAALAFIAAAIVFGEVRLASGSVWPSYLMHNVVNAFTLTLLLGDFIILDPLFGFLVSPGMEGILMIILTTVAGFWLYLRRRGQAKQVRYAY